jgi:hypothetical protein
MLLLWASSNPFEAALLAGTVIVLVLPLFSSRTKLDGYNGSIATQAWSLSSKLWLAVKQRIKAWAFLFIGRRMMQDAYEQVNTSSHAKRKCTTISDYGSRRSLKAPRFISTSLRIDTALSHHETKSRK